MRSRHLKLVRNCLRAVALALAIAGLVMLAGSGPRAAPIAVSLSSLPAFALSHAFHRRYRQRMGRRPMISVF